MTDKIEKTVALMTELVAANKALNDYVATVDTSAFGDLSGNEYYAEEYVSPEHQRTRELHQVIFDKGDELIFYMLEQFPITDHEAASVQFLEPWRNKVDTLSVDVLRSIPEQVVPLVVGLLSVGVHRIRYETNHMKGFDAFAGRYRDVIMRKEREI